MARKTGTRTPARRWASKSRSAPVTQRASATRATRLVSVITAIAISTAFHTTSRDSTAPAVAETTETTRTLQLAQRLPPVR